MVDLCHITPPRLLSLLPRVSSRDSIAVAGSGRFSSRRRCRWLRWRLRARVRSTQHSPPSPSLSPVLDCLTGAYPCRWTPCRASPTYPSVDHHIHLWAADSGQWWAARHRGICAFEPGPDEPDEPDPKTQNISLTDLLSSPKKTNTAPAQSHIVSPWNRFFSRLCAQPLTLNSRRTSPLFIWIPHRRPFRRPIFTISSHPGFLSQQLSLTASTLQRLTPTVKTTHSSAQLSSAQLPPLPAGAKCPTKDLPPSISASAPCLDEQPDSTPSLTCDLPLSRRSPSVPPPSTSPLSATTTTDALPLLLSCATTHTAEYPPLPS